MCLLEKVVVHTTGALSQTLAPAPASPKANPSPCLRHTKSDASNIMRIQVDLSALSHVGLNGAVSDYFRAIRRPKMGPDLELCPDQTQLNSPPLSYLVRNRDIILYYP